MKGGSTAIIEAKKGGTGKQVTDERENQKQKQSRSHNQLKKEKSGVKAKLIGREARIRYKRAPSSRKVESRRSWKEKRRPRAKKRAANLREYQNLGSRGGSKGKRSNTGQSQRDR